MREILKRLRLRRIHTRRQRVFHQGLIIALLMLAVMSLVPPQVALCDADWSFTLVEPGLREHEVTKGTATIQIRNAKLIGKMRSKEGIEYKLTGIVSKGRIDAKFTVIGSEVLDMPFSGTHTIKRSQSGDLGFRGLESIVLTNGLAVLAIQREIPE